MTYILTDPLLLGIISGIPAVIATAYVSGGYALKSSICENGEDKAIKNFQKIINEHPKYGLVRLSASWAIHRYKKKHSI